MAEQTSTSTAILGATLHIPIAQLTPLLSAPSSRSIKAVVTLKWPYSSATKSVAFLLAEPDFRLRRTRGQVRVHFSGSSAEKIKQSGIESGDELVLSLDGVEFVHGEAVSTPGRGVEFELRFTERLLLEARQQDTQKLSILDINHPEPEVQLPMNGARIPIPEPEPLPSSATNTPIRGEIKLADDEFSSPAFIKRARTSYGSLWEDDFELADGSVKGKGRKRTRMSSTWTVDTQDDMPASPESEEIEEVQPQVSPVALNQAIQQSSIMTDEGVQTDDLEAGASETLLEFARQSVNASQAYETSRPAMGNRSNIGGFQVPPITFTGFTPTQEDQARIQPPSSPRLQPLSSENLPLVSPLLSRSVASFAEAVGQPLKQAQISHEGFTPVSNAQYLKQEVQDNDLASPVHRADYEPADGDEFIDDGPELHDSNLSGHLEHQYGDWERQTDVSNYEIPEPMLKKQSEDDRFSVEEHDEEYENHQSMDEPSQQYPDLDEILSEQRRPSRQWESVPNSIQYPDLSDHGDNLDGLLHSLSGPRSRSMTRSVSAQSAIIDLTESDDGEDEEVENMPRDPPLSRTPAEMENHVGSIDNGYDGESEEEEEDYDDENELNPLGALSRPQSGRVLTNYQEFDEDEGDEDQEMDGGLQPEEEYYDEDELDSQGNPYPPGYFEDREGELEEEEVDESYDEDHMNGSDDQMDEPPARPALQKETVVIDLLSSDDEQEPISAPVTHASANIPLERPNLSKSFDEDNGEGELDINSKELRSPSVRSQISLKSEEDEEEEAELSLNEELQDHPTVVRLSSIPRDEDGIDGSMELVEEDNGVESTAHLTSQSPLPIELVDHKDLLVSMEEELVDVSQDIAVSGESFELQQEEPSSSLQIVEQNPGSGFTAASGESFELQQEEPSSLRIIEQKSTSVFATTAGTESKDEEELEDVEMQEADVEVEIKITKEMVEVEFQAPTTPGPKDDTEMRNESTPLAFSLDGADDNENDEEINRRRSLREASYPAVRPSTMENRPSPYRPSLFSRMFSIDGANDEPDEPITYPTLPNDELSPPSTTANSQNLSQNLSQNFGVRFPIGAAQLPTPDDTQTADDVISQQSSFTSAAVTSEHNVEVIVESTSSDILEDGALEDSALEPINASEDIAVSTVQESLEAFRQESHDALQQHIEASQDTSDDSVVEDLIDVAEIVDTIMDDSMVETGSIEEIEVETVVEKTTIVQETMNLTIDEGVTSPRLMDDNVEGETEEIAGESQVEPSPEQSLPAEMVVDEPEFTAEAPRRSHRRAKSISKTATSKENVKPTPVTPLKVAKAAASSSARSDQSPRVVIDQGSTPKGHDASIELALSSLESPEKHHDLRRPPMTDLKLRLNRNLRTELEEFKSLKILRYELNNKKFNVLAIATSATPVPERVKNGPRHYQITFNITDPSVAPAGVTEIQIFRPYKEALPIIKAGDGVLLRDFQVVSLKNRGFGLKSDVGCSSWAVFKSGVEVEVRGPPVEYGDGEKNHIAQMKEWYGSLDAASVAKLRRANGDKSAGTGV